MKWIFLSIVTIAVIASFIIGEKDMSLKVAFPSVAPAESYEPTRIHMAPEYIFLENIYSTLVEFNKEGEITSGIAEKFEWRDKDLHLFIRKDLTTVDGYSINAEDVILSLKRLLLMSSNTHGNFKSLVCKNKQITKVTDNCEGLILLSDYELIIRTDKKSDFLVTMLTALDFAIIPKRSFDHSTLKIIDYKNTSGPYFVLSDNLQGEIMLAPNKGHYHYNSKMPQEISLVPSVKYGDSVRLLDQGVVDTITTVDNMSAQDILLFGQQNSKRFSVHTTMNIRTVVINFTKSGIDKYSKVERKIVAEKIKKILRSYYSALPGYKVEYQFLIGEGGLSNEQLNDLKKDQSLYTNKEIDTANLTIGLLRIGKLEEFKKILRAIIEPSRIFEISDNPNFSDVNLGNEPDIFISGPDVSYKEDIGLISYSINSGDFHISDSKGEEWLSKYMENLNKEERVKLLNKLHFESLYENSIIPVVSGPYVAISNSEWDMNLSPLYANNQLWLYRRK